ncbi:CAP domain-containing protein [Podospora fimiseda]|uniref:CAP domain-containing protein n=1 Tax=Podospora fimiseda TaxID=252190 RepID=A0AAN7BNF3_9PEZI|nr:CAP domain-containing protein [Podospora fimiseda]
MLSSLSLLLTTLPLLTSTTPLQPVLSRATLDSPPPTSPSFINFVLQTVNPIRAQHSADPLLWDTTLATAAFQKANGCKLNHTGPYGENAYYSWYWPPDFQPDFNVEIQSAFQSWNSLEEINAYLSGNLLGGGHFTQTVWKATKRIGCAFSTTRCTQNPNQEWWFYCDFWPRGNYRGWYAGNVTV